MNKSKSNLYYKILKIIQKCRVNSFREIAKTLDVPEEILRITIQSLEERGYLTMINENEYQKEIPLACKFCPFANECSISKRIPTIFYELSHKGKNTLNNYKIRYDNNDH